MGYAEPSIATITDVLQAKRAFLLTWQALEQQRQSVFAVLHERELSDEEAGRMFDHLMTLVRNMDLLDERITELESEGAGVADSGE